MKSIKTKLILLIVGALFIVSATFGVISYTQARKILLEQTEENFLQITQEISRVIQANMKVNIARMEGLAERRIVDDNTPWAEKVAYFKEEADRMGFDTFAIADTNGNSIRTNMERTPAKISNREYYTRAMAGIPTYSDVYFSEVTGNLIVSISVPIKRGGRITGVLYGVRHATEISELIKDVKLGETGYAYIVNKDGTVQGHRDEKLVLDAYNPIKASAQDKTLEGLAGAMKRTINGETGVAQYLFQGIDRYTAFTPIATSNSWSVIVAMDLYEILAGTVQLRNIILIITIGLLVLGSVLA